MLFCLQYFYRFLSLQAKSDKEMLNYNKKRNANRTNDTTVISDSEFVRNTGLHVTGLWQGIKRNQGPNRLYEVVVPLGTLVYVDE